MSEKKEFWGPLVALAAVLLTGCADIGDTPQTRYVGNGVWATDDTVRGVTCYRREGSRAAPHCVKVKP